MHFEILVEDQSGKRALDVLVPKIVGERDTYTIHPYKGIGRIPGNMKSASDASKRILLDQLPRLLQGYGKAYSSYQAAVVVVCDLDDRDRNLFLGELMEVLNGCHPKPQTRFCLSIEEGEAWLLGDLPAVKAAYPKAKDKILNGYKNDSICGTWEWLADAVYNGGAQALKKKGWQAIGREKSIWAERISPFMDVDHNRSPSFGYFKSSLLELSAEGGSE